MVNKDVMGAHKVKREILSLEGILSTSMFCISLSEYENVHIKHGYYIKS